MRDEARALIANTSLTISVRDLTWRRLMDTRVESDTSDAPSLTLAESDLEKLRAGDIVVSNVFLDEATGEFTIAVAKPVLKANRIIVVTVPTSSLNKNLVSAVPDGWVVGIADRSGVYVTRSALHSEFAGKPGLPSYLGLAIGRSGSFKSQNQLGETLLAGYYRSDFSGWLYAANIPLSNVEAPFWRSIYEILGIGCLALAISLLLAYIVGKHLTRETAELVDRAVALGNGRVVEPFQSRLQEFAFVHDALKQAEISLRESESELRTVLETVPAGVWFTYDPTARRVIRNRVAAEMMGLSEEESAGVPDTVIDTIAIKDGQTITRENRPLTRAMRGEETDHEEYSYLLPDGRQRYLLSSARPIFSEAGKVIGAVQISLDISERKRIEEQRDLVTRELTHRVKNNLAVVQALANQTIRNSADLKEAGIALGARLSALGRAHDLLNKSFWSEADLRALLESTLLVAAPVNQISLRARM